MTLVDDYKDELQKIISWSRNANSKWDIAEEIFLSSLQL